MSRRRHGYDILHTMRKRSYGYGCLQTMKNVDMVTIVYGQ